MDKITELIKDRKYRIGIGVLIIVTLISLTLFMLLKQRPIQYTYTAREGSKNTFVFEYGQEIDYSLITKDFFLSYNDSDINPKFMDDKMQKELDGTKDDSFYVSVATIDTTKITHRLNKDSLDSLLKLDRSNFYDFIINEDTTIPPIEATLEVYKKLPTENELVGRAKISYVIIDTVPPTLENVQDMSVAFGTEVETSSIKARDPIDGELKVEVSNSGFDKSTPGTYDFTAKAVDSNGLETSQGFKVTVEEEKVAVVDTTNDALPSTGGSSSSGSQSNNGGSNSSGSNNSGNNSNSGSKPGGTPENSNSNRCYVESYGYYDCDDSIPTYCDVHSTGQYWCGYIGKAPWELDPSFDMTSDAGLELCKATKGCVINYIED